MPTDDSFSLAECLSADGQQVIDAILADRPLASSSSSLNTQPLFCPETNWTTPHRWVCPFLEDPYWVCELCAEQTQNPGVLPTSLLTVARETEPPVAVASPVVAVPFRIQRATGSKRPKRSAKLGLPRSLARVRKMVEAPGTMLTATVSTDRKYLSKKKQQALQALQLYRGHTTHPPSQEVLRKLREAWPETNSHDAPAPILVSLLNRLGLRRYGPDLHSLLKALGHPVKDAIGADIESSLLVDLDRVLRAYLRYETRQADTHKRRQLDCSYLVYQLLKHRHIDVYEEQVQCRDREYHNVVYQTLAAELKLTFWPLAAVDIEQLAPILP